MSEYHIKGGTTTQSRYGSDFIMARARQGQIERELTAIPNRDKLKPEEIEAVIRQMHKRNSERMNSARKANRKAREAKKEALKAQKALQDALELVQASGFAITPLNASQGGFDGQES